MGFEEDDTYSVILKALHHPIRRRVLRMLEAGPLSYTEILRRLGVENGLLNYHLERLSTLVAKNEDEHYVLSDFGRAAVALNSKVEWATPSPRDYATPMTMRRVLVAFAVVLIAVSCLYIDLRSQFTALKNDNEAVTARLEELTSLGLYELKPVFANITTGELPIGAKSGVSVVDGFCLSNRDWFDMSEGVNKPGFYHATFYCPEDNADCVLSITHYDYYGSPLTVIVTRGVMEVKPQSGVPLPEPTVYMKTIRLPADTFALPKKGWYTISCYPATYADSDAVFAASAEKRVSFQIWFNVIREGESRLFAVKGW